MATSVSVAQDWEQVGNINYAVDHLFADTVDGSLYVGGNFRFFNGIETRGIFRLDSSGNVHQLGTGQDGCGPFNCYPVKTINRYKDEIYIGWTPETINGGTIVNGIARWDGTTWKPLQNGFQEGSSNQFMVHDGSLYVAGAFELAIGTDTTYGIAKWDGTNWESLDFPVYLEDFPLAQDAVWFKEKLYLGGGFFFGVEGGFILDIASYDGQTWSAVGEGIKGFAWHGIKDMIVYKDELYVCGSFRKIDGNVGNKVMRWDGWQWKEVGGGLCEPNAIANDLLIHDDKLYVIGIFNCVGDGLPVSNIATWDGERWCSVGNSYFDNKITAISFWKDELYVGGGFNHIDGEEVWWFAKFIGDHSTDICSEPVSSAQESSQQAFAIWPNPATSTLQIQAPAPLEFVQVYDAMGRVVLQSTVGNEVSVAHLPAGLYFVSARAGGTVWGARFVKE
ncbi:MAG TPA: T9SS type A sorting domain-containing protein [Saprospiraceae bacterium]|nr:T9SS type A sorting domain-containing protein [Saprospiraceae bacterium]